MLRWSHYKQVTCLAIWIWTTHQETEIVNRTRGWVVWIRQKGKTAENKTYRNAD